MKIKNFNQKLKKLFTNISTYNNYNCMSDEELKNESIKNNIFIEDESYINSENDKARAKQELIDALVRKNTSNNSKRNIIINIAIFLITFTTLVIAIIGLFIKCN